MDSLVKVAGDSRIDDLRRRVEKDPASIAFAQLAEEYRRVGDHESAIRACEAGLAHHPAYISARVTLARALFELGRLDEARAEFERVLGQAPDHSAARDKLSEIERLSSAGAAPSPGPPSHEAGAEADASDPVLAEFEAWLEVIDEDRRRRANADQ